MEKKIIISDKIPVSGSYSPAIEAAGLVFISGQLPVHPVTGEVITDIQPATKQVINNLKRILGECGLTLESIVKTTIYLKSMDDLAAVNEIYSGFFPANPPARSTVAVAALPKNARLEMDATAVR